MKTHYIHIQPLDALFFRAGKPFGKGEESWVEPSMLIPHPTVVWGALFTALLFDNQVSTAEKNALKIKSVYLYNKTDKKILIPAPLDLFFDGDKDSCFFPEKYQTTPISSSQTGSLVLPDALGKIETAENLFISIEDLPGSYHSRNPYRTTVYQPSNLSVNAPKIGIARDKFTRTADEGQLFKIEMIQLFENWGFLVECETDKNITNGVLKLGGDGKLASYSNVEKPDFLNNISDALKNLCAEKGIKGFKIYVQSPTFWESGDGISEMKKLGLYSACIGKYIPIGGFDMATKSPKQMLKAVPSGSVYLIENDDFEKTISGIKTIIEDNKNNINGFGYFQVIPFKKRKTI